jgi:hypothetical protein
LENNHTKMSAMKSVRFRQDQVSVFNGNNCPLSAGFSVRNHRNTQLAPINTLQNEKLFLSNSFIIYFIYIM